MPYKDAQKQREYVREYQRKRRSKDGYSRNGINHAWRLETADDLKGVLECVISELMDAEELDLGVKGRVVASLLSVGLKLLEVGQIEERLERLEARILGVKT